MVYKTFENKNKGFKKMKKILLITLLLLPTASIANSVDNQRLLMQAKQTGSIVQVNASNKTTHELQMLLAQAKNMGVQVQVLNNPNSHTTHRNSAIIEHFGATQVLTPKNNAKSRAQQMREKAQNRHNKFNKNN